MTNRKLPQGLQYSLVDLVKLHKVRVQMYPIRNRRSQHVSLIMLSDDFHIKIKVAGAPWESPYLIQPLDGEGVVRNRQK